MITQCNIPDSLRYSKKGIDFNAMQTLVFQGLTSESQTIQSYKELTEYKLCMIEEFLMDDDHLKAQNLLEKRNFSVFHKLYRKQLEPKFTSLIEI